MSRGGAEREGDTESKAGSRLRAVSKEPNAGLKLTTLRSRVPCFGLLQIVCLPLSLPLSHSHSVSLSKINLKKKQSHALGAWVTRSVEHPTLDFN